LVAGWAVIAFGVLGLVGSKNGLRGAFEVGAWVAGGHLIHDAILVPVTVAVGLVVARVVGPRFRAPVRAGLIASACVVAVVYPALRGFGRKPNNPTVLPLDYTSAVLVALAVVWGLVVVWIAVLQGQAWRRRRRRADAEHRV
jgi:hypothetical protein